MARTRIFTKLCDCGEPLCNLVAAERAVPYRENEAGAVEALCHYDCVVCGPQTVRQWVLLSDGDKNMLRSRGVLFYGPVRRRKR